MRGVTISDKKNSLLAFDLIDILKLIGEKAFLSTWKIFNVECIGEEAETLHNISDRGMHISGNILFSISSNLIQVINGEFEAYFEGDSPWLIIKAIDSSEYDVKTDDNNIITKMKNSFSDVVALPNE